MSNPLVIGLDLGTTTCKALAIDAVGAAAASATGRVGTLLPRPGWVAQDAEELWAVVASTLRRVVDDAGGRTIAGLGLSGAMHSVLPVGGDGGPLAPAMTWADDRGAAKLRAVRQQVGAGAAGLYERTGCPLQGLYHPARLRWWREDAPELAAKAARFVALRDFIGFMLTGAWATDHSLASTTGLLDIRRMAWDAEALSVAGVTAERLPPLVAPGAAVGHATAAAARATGLPQGLPIFAGGSDGAMANLGAAGSGPGRVVITVGTSGAVRLTCDRPRVAGGSGGSGGSVTSGGGTWCYVMLRDRWIAGGAINNGGLAAEWVRDRLYVDQPGAKGFDLMMSDAATVAPGADGLIALPYFAGERSPHWQPDARGAFIGLSLNHGRAHLARATLEGVAFCLADVWDALCPSPEEGREVNLTGGIVHSPVWCQIVADVLGAHVMASEAADASALGAARLALVGVGLCEEASLGPALAESSVRFTPDAQRRETYCAIRSRFQALGRDVVFERRAQAQAANA